MRGHGGKAVLGLLLTAALLWWVLRDVSAYEVLAEIRRADPLLLAAMVATATASFLLRAMRWRVLLLPAHPGTGLRSRFGATCIGFMANNVFPARLGEIARAFALSRSERIGVSPSLASLVVERVFDTLVLAFFLLLTMSLPGFPGGEGEGAAILRRTAAIGAGGFAAGFAGLWLMVRYPEPTMRLFEHSVGRLLTPRVTDRVIRIMAGFIRGLGALHRPVIFLRALAWSVVVWLCLALSIWLGLLAFGITAPGFMGAIFLQAVIAFGVAIPSSPGFFGVFEAAAKVGLGVYGVGSTGIVSFATGYHVLTFLPVTLLGLFYAHSFGIRWSEMGHGEELVESSVAGNGGTAGAESVPGAVRPHAAAGSERRQEPGEGGRNATRAADRSR